MLTIREVFLVFVFVEDGSFDGNILLILPASQLPTGVLRITERISTESVGCEPAFANDQTSVFSGMC